MASADYVCAKCGEAVPWRWVQQRQWEAEATGIEVFSDEWNEYLYTHRSYFSMCKGKVVVDVTGGADE